MARKNRNKEPKIIISIISHKGTQEITATQMHNARTGETVPIGEDMGGCKYFSDAADMKETLNWCFDGDPEAYHVNWEMIDNAGTSHGKAYIYD